MPRAIAGSLICLLATAVTAPLAGAQSYDEIAFAVLPAPEAERASATVLGFRDGALETLRPGDGAFVCIADDPSDERFRVLCYHVSLEPYMARGRALRAEGITGKSGIEKRWAEIESGKLEMPKHPAALHQLFGSHPDSVSLDGVDDMGRLTVIYMAYATVEETGLPPQPSGTMPWLMYAGTPTAHVMISGR
jgi:hypothetical protein